MDIATQCQFTDPQLSDGQPATSTEQMWNFSKMFCTTTEPRAELIQNESTSTSFFLQQTISYGDFLVIGFLLLFTIFAIATWLVRWFIPTKLDWKQH